MCGGGNPSLPILAIFLFTEIAFSQTKYPSVQNQNTMSATETIEVTGKFKVNQETRLLEETYLEKFKDLTMPATQDRLVVIDKFGKLKALGETTGPGQNSGAPVLPEKIFPYWRLTGNALGTSSTINNPFIGSTNYTDVVFKTYNTERMRITANGTVNVTGNLHATGKISATAYTSNSPLIFEAPVGMERMRISDVNGSVGIGTNQPDEKLTVKGGNIRVDDSYDLLLRNSHHGLGWYSGDGSTPLKKFNNADIDGPVLYGYGGGALGVKNNSESVVLRWTWDGKVGVGTTAPPAKLNIYEGNESNLLTNFTQSTNNAGVLISTDYAPDTYTPGLFWSTVNDNASKPKAGIWLKQSALGTDMYFGTSNSFANGIHNTGLIISHNGNIGLGDVTAGVPSKLTIRLTNAFTSFVNGSLSPYFSIGIPSGNGGYVPIDFTEAGSPNNPIARIAAYQTEGGSKLCFGTSDVYANGITNLALVIDPNGTVRAKKIRIEDIGDFPDFVFDETHTRLTIEEKELFYKTHKHMPNIPSAKELEKDGLDISDVMKGMMQNIEEDRLDITELYKIIQQQKKEIEMLKIEMQKMKEGK